MNELYIAWSPVYMHPLPERHRFPMLKYELIPGQLQHEGAVTAAHLHEPGICTDEIVLLTHSDLYLAKLHQQTLSDREQRKIGFMQSPALTLRELVITQGTINCCYAAINNGVALNVAGGTHHAYKDHGEGFCLLNDFAVAANYLLHKNEFERLMIIDLDVHQGNGTAKIFEQDSRVFTFSMHGAHNYPFHKEKSDLDIALPDGTDDITYLQLLKDNLVKILEQQKPELAFFLSGVDILHTDRFGKLAITMQGCSERDAFVFNILRDKKIPCVVAMGGGYSADIKIVTEAHCNTFRLAKDIYRLE